MYADEFDLCVKVSPGTYAKRPKVFWDLAQERALKNHRAVTITGYCASCCDEYGPFGRSVKYDQWVMNGPIPWIRVPGHIHGKQCGPWDDRKKCWKNCTNKPDPDEPWGAIGSVTVPMRSKVEDLSPRMFVACLLMGAQHSYTCPTRQGSFRIGSFWEEFSFSARPNDGGDRIWMEPLPGHPHGVAAMMQDVMSQ